MPAYNSKLRKGRAKVMLAMLASECPVRIMYLHLPLLWPAHEELERKMTLTQDEDNMVEGFMF